MGKVHATSILLCLFALTISLTALRASNISPTLGEGSETLKEAGVKLQEAFNGVRVAEEAGAGKQDVEALVLKLNNALELVMNGEKAFKAGDLEAAENYALKSMDLSVEVKAEAQRAKENAERRMFQSKVYAFTSAPIAAFILAVAFHYSYKAWRKREFNRLLRMEIREVKGKR